MLLLLLPICESFTSLGPFSSFPAESSSEQGRPISKVMTATLPQS